MSFLKTILAILFLGVGSQIFAQSFIQGHIYNDSSQALIGVKITNSANSIVYFSDSMGYYRLPYVRKKRNALTFEYKGFKPYTAIAPNLFEDEDYTLNIRLNDQVQTIRGSGVRAKVEERSDIVLKPLNSRPSVSGDFSDFIKSLAGVSSNNELSSQYNVRGGSYDENLIYVNDIEIYRPQLVRSGQQEGLSFIQPDMVSNVKFSAGGFEAKFGDKLSSVLDVQYRTPKQFSTGIQAGVMGGSIYTEGLFKARKRIGVKDSTRFTYLLGSRYRANRNLLNSFDAQGLYKSKFGDLQALMTYHFNRYHRLECLLNYAQNRYSFAPEYQETTFGTFQNTLKVNIGMDGQEIVDYQSGMGALSWVYQKQKVELKWMASAFASNESEHYDILGAYEIGEVDNNIGSSSFGKIKSLIGRGFFINHARNDLYFTVYNLSHQGQIKFNGPKTKHAIKQASIEQLRHPGKLVYGIKFQAEQFDDRYLEWKYNDSGGYSMGNSNDSAIYLSDQVRAKNVLNNSRLSAYTQWHQAFGSVNQMSVTAGLRYLYTALNQQELFSPRVQLYYEPNKYYNQLHKSDSIPLKKNMLLKAAWGVYYQAPFYREMRNFDGQLNRALKAQRSIHYTAGVEFGFKSASRPFKFSGELFYKDLDYLVPYILDNIRIRYYANNAARGYATGLDMRVNGEFIKGLESWFSLSVLKTDEIIRYVNTQNEVTESPWLRRPTDRRISAAVMFQDELKSNKDYRVHLMLNYGSSLPFYLGGQYRYEQLYSIPSYRRVDIGFSKVLIGGVNTKKTSHTIKNMWLGLDVYNLLQINNVISYLWIKDYNNQTYGVPNYLTGRRLNLRLVTAF